MINQTTKIIKKSLPAVVSIVISKSLEDIEKEIPAELFPLFPFGVPHLQIPEDKIDRRGMVEIGGGSGFIVNPNGTILTNKHVISDPKSEYTVVTNDGKKYAAEILARDPVDDVAILKINVKNLPVIELGDSANLDLGEEVIAIGNTLGLFKNTVSKGIISGLSRSIAAKTEINEPITELRGLIQTDTAINPGNSGGPLLNMNGRVIGINTAIVFGAQNVGFAIPINAAKRDLEDLKKYGRVRRPLLGLRYLTIDEKLQEKMGLPVNYGAVVAGQAPHHEAVIPGTPAAKAGVKPKDIILECNDEKINRDKTIQDFLEKLSVGDILKMKILRGKKQLEIKVLLAERK
ncbi:MAG: trypsin-like peptidase domain-containing protein [Candidatus Harrisonbacteria bacterium]|nr:trypsin-like peptidase domain-containing protein [Candidatus Harrisonbacteria bacterium]